MWQRVDKDGAPGRLVARQPLAAKPISSSAVSA
jgi:hypothetical protein